MSRLGAPHRVAAAVSGGADSTALALLAQAWGADVLALIVDHGLRAASAAEAALTLSRLAARGIAGLVITLRLDRGPALQARARAARYAALSAAALAAGRLHILLGHHAADQSETVAMRALRGAGGAEGMAAWAARDAVVLLRPLLGVQPQALREYLAAQNMPWIEDPSNQERKFERVRLRQSCMLAMPAAPEARQSREIETAVFLARHASIYPEGYAVLDAAQAPAAALGALLRVTGGREYGPPQAAVAALGEKLRPATLGGVRMLASKRLGGWLLVREPAGLAPPVHATSGAIWDHRFVLEAAPAAEQKLGALGTDAIKFRGFNGLPSIVLRGMPCLRDASGAVTFPAPARFHPPAPVTSHPFIR
jgi:tRNA(Ile)-lysidine synthase